MVLSNFCVRALRFEKQFELLQNLKADIFVATISLYLDSKYPCTYFSKIITKIIETLLFTLIYILISV